MCRLQNYVRAGPAFALFQSVSTNDGEFSNSPVGWKRSNWVSRNVHIIDVSIELSLPYNMLDPAFGQGNNKSF